MATSFIVMTLRKNDFNLRMKPGGEQDGSRSNQTLSTRKTDLVNDFVLSRNDDNRLVENRLARKVECAKNNEPQVKRSETCGSLLIADTLATLIMCALIPYSEGSPCLSLILLQNNISSQRFFARLRFVLC